MPTRRYAARTVVPVEQTEADIKRVLVRYGADQVLLAWDRTEGAVVGFRLHGRAIRIRLPVPDTTEMAVRRQRWRALLLVLKAKLEAIESGIVTLEDEFLGYVVLPSGETMGEWAAPQLAAAIAEGRMPALLPRGREG